MGSWKIYCIFSKEAFMDIFDSLRTQLYTQAIQHCQQSFSARMQIPGQGIAFVQRLDGEHAPLEVEARDALLRIQRTYDSSIAKTFNNVCLGGGAVGGLGALFFGIVCASAGPGAWLFGAAFGGALGGIGGAVSGGVITKADACRVRLKALQELFQGEVDFVNQRSHILNLRILQFPGENLQLQVLREHFDWVLNRRDDIEREYGETQRREAEESSRRDVERRAYNDRQRSNRNSYVMANGFSQGHYQASANADRLYPDRIF
jgi:hypothetical protein